MKRTLASKPRNLQSAPKKVWAKHRTLTIVIALLALTITLVGVLKYVAYNNRFSEKDFTAIEEAAEGVFARIGVSDVKRNRHCRYRAPEKYSSVRLYCSIQLAGYLTYENDEQAILVAKNLEKEIAKLGLVASYFERFYEKPSDTLTDAIVDGSVFRGQQCAFTIASNEKAMGAATILPEKSENKLIAVVFDCSAESREEYFPVTYRQGE